jgi:hypothetical protein
MTKKDYQMLAACIFMAKAPGSPYHNPPFADVTSRIAYQYGFSVALIRVQDAIALECELANPRFDRQRFIEACEIEACETGRTRGKKQVKG